MRTALSLIIGLGALAAQVAATPHFEAVVIKPVQPAEMANGTDHGVNVIDPSRWRAQAVTLYPVIAVAYGVKVYSEDRVFGLPDWAGTTVYDMDAVIPAGTHQAQIAPMVRALLADRFHLQAHLDTLPMPAGSLSLGPGGARLTPAPECESADLPLRVFNMQPGEAAVAMAKPFACGTYRGTRQGGQVVMTFHGMTMAQLADYASTQVLPVVDQTGLKGTYDFTLSYPMTGTVAEARAMTREQLAARADATRHAIAAAYLAQLGLKLENARPRTLPVKVVVVDHIEHPTPN